MQGPEQAARLAGNAQAGAIDDAVKFGSVLIWTVRERDPSKIVSEVSLLDGKILVDINNRDYANEVAGESRWFDVSLGETLQAKMPRASVIKAFNTVAMETFNTSAERLRQSGAQIFVAGAGQDARRQIMDMAAVLGFASFDLGEGKLAMRSAEALGDVIRYCMIDKGAGGRANIAIHLLPSPDMDVVGSRQSSAYH